MRKEDIWNILESKFNIDKQFLCDDYLNSALTGAPFWLKSYQMVYLLMEIEKYMGIVDGDYIKNKGLYTIRNILEYKH